MSFSADLKLELSEIQPHAQHCRIAELAGLVSLLGKYFDKKILIRIENEVVFNDTISNLIKRSFRSFKTDIDINILIKDPGIPVCRIN